jgi:AcrR family transcriptional regulator
MRLNKKDSSTEKKILEAAKRIFQLKGMDGARMQEIANEASINKALLHYYFRSKQLLFEAVFKEAFSMIAPQLNVVMNEDTSLFEKIKKFSANYISFIIKHPYLPNFIIQELNKNPLFIKKIMEEKNFPSISKFKFQVDENIANGTIKPIDSSQLFINLISLNILPFLAAPLLKGFLNLDDEKYLQLLENRKTEVADFIISAIKT